MNSGSSMGCVAGEGYMQGAMKRKNLDKKDERPGRGPWLFGLEFFVGDGIPLRVADGTVWWVKVEAPLVLSSSAVA